MKRITKSLESILEVLGDRHVVLAREMTKLHEEFLRGTVTEVLAKLNKKESLKGELTVIIAPDRESEQSLSKEGLAQRIRDELCEKSVSQTASTLSKELGLNKKQIYKLALEIKDGL